MLSASALHADTDIKTDDMQALAAAYQLLSDGNLVGAQEAYKALRTSVDDLAVQRAATEGEAYALMRQLTQLRDKSKSGATVGPLLRGRKRITVNFIADQLEAHTSETLSYLLTLAESDLSDPQPDYSGLAFAANLLKLPDAPMGLAKADVKPVEAAPVKRAPDIKTPPKQAEKVAVKTPEKPTAKPTTKPRQKPQAKPTAPVVVKRVPAKPIEPILVRTGLPNLVKMPSANVKVRQGPGRSYPQVGSIRKGQRLIVNQKVSVAGGGDWYRLVTPSGYAAASLFTTYKEPVAKPVKRVKPTPEVKAKPIAPKPAKVQPIAKKPKPVLVPVKKAKVKPVPKKPKKSAKSNAKCKAKNNGMRLLSLDGVNVHSKPGGKILLKYNKNVVMHNIIGETGSHYVLRISSNGKTVCGYISKKAAIQRKK